MKIDLAIDERLTLPLAYARTLPLLDDLEGTIGRFPKLRRLTRLDAHSYRWEMATMGSRLARIAHDVSYGARYTIDRAAGELRWEPIAGQGNALIGGAMRLRERGAQTEIRFSVHGTLHDVPVPLLYRPVAGAFIQGKFRSLVERFLAATGEALGSPHHGAER